MFNTNSLDFKNKTSIYQNNYTEEESLFDFRFGEIFVIRSKIDNKKILIKEKISLSESEFKKDLYQIKERIKIDSGNIIKLLDYSCGNKNGTYLVTGYYEYPDNPLNYEFDKRIEEQGFFTSLELTMIILNVLNGLAYLENNKFISGGLSLSYIYYDEDKNCYKFTEKLGLNCNLLNIFQSDIKKENEFYISPEVFNCIIRQEEPTNNMLLKNELFSLGLIILELGLLKKISKIYNINELQFNTEKLNYYIKKFEYKYIDDDENLIKILKQMLDLEVESRYTPKNFLEKIKFEYINSKSFMYIEKNINPTLKQKLNISKPLNYKSDKINLINYPSKTNTSRIINDNNLTTNNNTSRAIIVDKEISSSDISAEEDKHEISDKNSKKSLKLSGKKYIETNNSNDFNNTEINDNFNSNDSDIINNSLSKLSPAKTVNNEDIEDIENLTIKNKNDFISDDDNISERTNIKMSNIKKSAVKRNNLIIENNKIIDNKPLKEIKDKYLNNGSGLYEVIDDKSVTNTDNITVHNYCSNNTNITNLLSNIYAANHITKYEQKSKIDKSEYIREEYINENGVKTMRFVTKIKQKVKSNRSRSRSNVKVNKNINKIDISEYKSKPFTVIRNGIEVSENIYYK